MSQKIAKIPETLLSRARAAAAEAREYLCRRQSPEGGFCFYRTQYIDEPNLGDTYHAVAALRLLGAEVPRLPQLLRYLHEARQFGLSYLYYYAATLDVLGEGASILPEHLASICQLTVVCPDARHRIPTSEWLLSTWRTLLLQQRFCPVPAYPHVLKTLRGMRKGTGFGDKPNLPDTSLGLSILSMLQDPSDPSDLAAFVEGQQRLPAGFTMTADSSMATLDVLLAGVRCCALLGLPVRYASEVLEFTLGCAARDGGFARAPLALPDIEFTHRALQVIASVASETIPPATQPRSQ